MIGGAVGAITNTAGHMLTSRDWSLDTLQEKALEGAAGNVHLRIDWRG